MSFNSSLNSNVVKTALDKVFFQKFNVKQHPGYADATTAKVFKQDSVDNSAVIMELFGGTGAWEQTAEEESIPKATPRVTNKKTFSVVKFSKSVVIPSEYFDDEMHSTINMLVENMARNAYVAREKNAWGIFNNAATTTLTSDGVALISDSHETISGDTVDNKGTAALTPDSLDDAITALVQQTTQDGEIGGHMPSCLVVPPALFKTACETVDSELEADTADNQVNVFSSKYSIYVYTSPWLTDDNNWFLLSENHSITRWVREGISTEWVDAKYSDNDTHIYKGKFREVVGVMNFEGIYGSIVA